MKLNIADQVELPSSVQLWQEYEQLFYPDGMISEQKAQCQLAFMGGVEALFKVIDLVLAAPMNNPKFRAKVLETYRVLNQETFNELAKKDNV